MPILEIDFVIDDGLAKLDGPLVAPLVRREVFIIAAPWVPAQKRLFHLRAKVDGNPTTLPIQIRVVDR